ncbi:hypothetical protein GCK32_004804, partial [Trichostrongylus colubriformis]
MICGQRSIYSRLCPSSHIFRAYFHSSLALKSIGRHAKLQKRKDSLAAYPPEFRAKLKEWPKLLQAEIDEGVSHLKELREVSDLPVLEDRGLLLGNLRLVSDDLHPITGRTVILKRIQSGDGADRFKIFRSGAPVAIRDAKTLKEIAECVMLASNRKEIKIKIRPSSASRHLDGDTEYVLTMSQSSGALHSVQDFFLQNKAVDTPGADLLGYAFRAKNMPSIHNDRMVPHLSDELNDSQRRAVSAALNNRRPFVTIQGPPGTGKTRVVAEIVRQLLRKKLKTLVCAPSNVAVDKVMTEVLKLLDDEQLKEDFPSDRKREMISDAETIEEALTANEKYPELCGMFDQMNASTDQAHRAKLKTAANKLKWKIIKESYKRRLAIFCTLTSSAIQRLSQVNWHPDVIIIDEAAQASEPVAWAAVVQAKRCILAGDHAQLPSTILSSAARKGNLDVSLMERLAKDFHNANINQLLTVQYRMNEKIMQWSSREFYESRLVAAEEVSNITLSDISFISSDSPLNEPLIMINTDLAMDRGTGLYRELPSQMSFRNPGEAALVARYVDVLRSIGISEKEIAVISPYYAQVASIRDIMSASDVSVNTVDSFQGQEREVVVFSMVRHNPEKVIGFLQNERRLNVAITRAKRQFVLIGSARMMKNRHLRSLLSTVQSCGKTYAPEMMDTFENGEKDFFAATSFFEERSCSLLKCAFDTDRSTEVKYAYPMLLQGIMANSIQLEQARREMSVIIRLQLLPLSANAADVRAFFNGLRIPDGAVHIVGGDDGDAFIGFATDEDARQAMRRDRGQIHGEEVRLYLSSRAEMNDVITRAKAAVLGLRVPSPKVDQSPVHQEPVPSWTSPAQPHYASPPTLEPTKPSSFAPDPSEFNKPLYMRGPPQQQHLQHQQEQYHPQQAHQQQQQQQIVQPQIQQQHQPQPLHQSQQPHQQRYPPAPTSSTPQSPHNNEYRGNHRGYPPAPMNSYPPTQETQQSNGATMPPRDESMYERKYPPAEPKRFPSEVPHRPPYQNQPDQRPSADTAPRFFSAPPRNPNINRPMPPGMPMPPRGIPSQSPRDDQKPAGPGGDVGYGPPSRPPYGGPPGHLRGPPGAIQGNRAMEENGDPPGYGRERYNGPVALQQEERRPPGGPRAAFPPGRDEPPVNGSGIPRPPSLHNRTSADPARLPGSWREDGGQPYGGSAPSWQSDMQKSGPNSGPPLRKPLISKTPSGFDSDRGFVQKPPMPPLGPQGGRPPIPPSQAMRQPQPPPMNRAPLLGPNFGAGPNMGRAAPSMSKYVELSRLPTEMLRPAVLEQFLRPSVPLQVSSVKVVYSSQGIHMNTLVSVRPSTKAIFDDAVDGLPPALLTAAEAVTENADHKRDVEHSRRRSRSRSRDRRRGKRDTSPRKRQRSRSRERHGNRRSRSRSAPKRSRQTTGSTRWCLQLTNVPFRCTEQELIAWMSERVRPSKVTRTFYADGNASDRWIAEFESESLMERAYGIKRLLIGRTVKMCHIENELADELLKIEDVYGERRKESSEMAAAHGDHRDSIKPLLSEPSGFGHGGGRGAP